MVKWNKILKSLRDGWRSDISLVVEKSNDCGNEQWTWKRAMVAEKSNDLLLVMIVTFNHRFIFNVRP